jgi:two-component system response regulator HydG
VLLLAQHFLSGAAVRGEPRVKGISPAAAAELLAYPWPGNVREVQNAIDHAVAVARYDEIAPEDLPPRVRSHRVRGAGAPEGEAAELVPLEEIERAYVTSVLARVSGNKRMGARILGLDRKTLYRKLERWGLWSPGETER